MCIICDLELLILNLHINRRFYTYGLNEMINAIETIWRDEGIGVKKMMNIRQSWRWSIVMKHIILILL